MKKKLLKCFLTTFTINVFVAGRMFVMVFVFRLPEKDLFVVIDFTVQIYILFLKKNPDFSKGIRCSRGDEIRFLCNL